MRNPYKIQSGRITVDGSPSELLGDWVVLELEGGEVFAGAGTSQREALEDALAKFKVWEEEECKIVVDEESDQPYIEVVVTEAQVRLSLIKAFGSIKGITSVSISREFILIGVVGLSTPVSYAFSISTLNAIISLNSYDFAMTSLERDILITVAKRLS